MPVEVALRVGTRIVQHDQSSSVVGHSVINQALDVVLGFVASIAVHPIDAGLHEGRLVLVLWSLAAASWSFDLSSPRLDSQELIALSVIVLQEEVDWVEFKALALSLLPLPLSFEGVSPGILGPLLDDLALVNQVL